jgi:hypothetical protein
VTGDVEAHQKIVANALTLLEEPGDQDQRAECQAGRAVGQTREKSSHTVSFPPLPYAPRGGSLRDAYKTDREYQDPLPNVTKIVSYRSSIWYNSL